MSNSINSSEPGFQVDITYSPDSNMVHRFINFERVLGDYERDGALSGSGLGGLYFSLTGIISSRTTQLWFPPAKTL